MYKNLIYKSTKDMSHEEWEEMRKGLKTIGGSDAGVLLGLNEYKSAFTLWAEKTGQIVPEDVSTKEAVRLGTDLEEYVAKRFSEETGKKLRRCNAVITNTALPWAHANVDRLVVGEDAGFEAKTTSSYDIIKQCREGKFPDTYYAQCIHYLAVTGAERWYLCILAFGTGLFTFTIDRDEAEIAALLSAEQDFYKLIENGRPPEIDGSSSTTQAVKDIFNQSSGTTVDLTGISDTLSMFSMIDKQIKQLEAQRDLYKNQIMSYMGNAEKGTYGTWTVSWKTQNRNTFDRKAFEADNGKIADKYFKNSTSRPFIVKEK